MDSKDLIPGYLIHEGYEETLKAFDQSDHSAKEITERCSLLADENKWMDVIFLLKESLPAVLNSETDLLFHLLSAEFVKILTKNRNEALEFAQKHFTPFQELGAHEAMIKDCMILFGHEVPNQIHPQPFLLTLEYRNLVAEKLRATIKYVLESLNPLESIHLSDDELREMSARTRILECVSKGQGKKAINMTKHVFPGLLEGDTDLCVQLLTLDFLELARSNKIPEAYKYSDENFAPFLKDSKSKHCSQIEVCRLTLIDENVSEADRLFGLYQKHASYKLNKAIRVHENHPSCSELERLIYVARERQRETGAGTGTGNGKTQKIRKRVRHGYGYKYI